MNVFSTLFTLCGSNNFVLSAQIISFLFKLFLLVLFCVTILKNTQRPRSWFLLLITIVCSLFENIAWIVLLLNKGYDFLLFDTTSFVLFAWATNAILYQSLALFIKSFKIEKEKSYNLFISNIFIVISALFSIIIFSALGFYLCNIPVDMVQLREIFRYQTFYIILILTPYSIFEGIRILQTENLPKILQQQLKASINFFLIPLFLANLWQNYPLSVERNNLTSHREAIAFSEIFLTLAIFYFVKTIVGLRFLNLHSHVHDGSKKFNFIYDFKTILEDLGNAHNMAEVKVLIYQFFKKAFDVDSQKIIFGTLIVYDKSDSDQAGIVTSPMHRFIEHFITHENFLCYSNKTGQKNNIKSLIYDEIAYTHFHEPTEFTAEMLVFLEKINADVFLPMYEEGRVIAYIILIRDARNKTLYTNIERDEMIIFITYAAKVVHLLQNRNLNELFKERKEITEELYKKHQEINKYKESVLSFLKMNKGNSIGIIFYKNRHFSFANEDALNILGVDPNKEIGDVVTKTLLIMAQKIENYKTPQLQIVKNIHNKRFVISGIPYSDSTGVIFTVYYPEVSDVIQELIDNIKDPSNWDYLLYLETTESGRLINELIPSHSEVLLNFKIELLKVALTKKALFLNVPEDDTVPIVELIHHISLKESLHVLNIENQQQAYDAVVSLFGINPLFNLHVSQESLLEKLDKKGTLFIKNIHFLDIESQKNLAEFIKYGFYKVLKTERKMFTDVRIICSSNQNLEYLAQEGLFSQALLDVLRITSLSFPSLLTLSQDEITTLIEGYREQVIYEKSGTDKLFVFTDDEKEQLLSQKIMSFFDLKKQVKELVMSKTKKSAIHNSVTFNPGYHVTDPKLVQAARLGKYALKDPQIMGLLWSKFKNQSQIALFLGVNRSSVYRRCKDYGLL